MGIDKMRVRKSLNNNDLLFALVRQNKSLKAELEQLKGYNELMQNKLFEYENEIVGLEVDKEKLTEKVEDLEEEINDLKIDLVNLEDDNYNWFSNDDLDS